MKNNRERAEQSAPLITSAHLKELKARLAAGTRVPALPRGAISVCPDCGGRMVTTNDLTETVTTPGLVYLVTGLGGACCATCGATELDGKAVGVVEGAAPREILGDYETTVTRSSGSTLGTYFRMDLARVLRLKGKERLYWKVVDRNSVLVRIHRRETPDSPKSRRARSSRARLERGPLRERTRAEPQESKAASA